MTEVDEIDSTDAHVRRVLDAIPDPLVIHRSGVPLYANPALLRYLGYASLEEALARTFADVVHPDHHDELSARYEQAVKTHEPAAHAEFRLRHTSGRWLVAEVTGVAIRWGREDAVLATLRDVTARRAIAADLRHAATSFRALIEHLPVPIAVVRAQRILYVNPAMAALLGTSESELAGADPSMVVPEEERALARERLLVAGSRGEAVARRELSVIRKDGARVFVESTILPTEWDGERAALILAQDLTERRAVHAHLVQTDRMASIGTLAAGLAHEINNPLSYVLANLRHAIEALGPLTQSVRRLERQSVAGDADGSMSAKLRELVETLDEASEGADRIKDVVLDVKTFARPDDGSTGKVEVLDVVESAVNMVRNEIRHRARLVKDYAPVPSVHANASRLAQVFVNLLVNAAQALPTGHASAHEIRVSVRTSEAGGVVVEVHDSGPGIPPEIVSRVFEPFFTTKPAGVGSGLGLAICRNIVTAAGGTIEVTSKAGRGTLFRVSLPSAPSDTGALRGAARSSVPVPARARILVVDDEPAVARALRRDLMRHHDVTIANGGLEAVNVLEADDSFDMVFCDLMMPDLTGMEVFESVRDRSPHLAERFVFMTGGAFTEHAREFLDRVENVCVDKPFRPDEVRELAQASFARRMAVRV